ncbi:uncharacterized protein SCHCODRAFT_02295871 [Schizophyllum commune H4-8]|uniref:uncharacterized protein n=1 Tax=Schizophyllum commune (strain H4-8 / FGSC 9210) TaxID=578458 RepID=UPI002160CC51|nr:uncharacterized protein SCHCODRAFT_02295871 [Schizophyllum commune H4-8]KAI5892603.1 hypothetical protein SCHCODRAFT_02295871 [Schizophyllum commune H4-8]
MDSSHMHATYALLKSRTVLMLNYCVFVVTGTYIYHIPLYIYSALSWSTRLSLGCISCICAPS